MVLSIVLFPFFLSLSFFKINIAFFCFVWYKTSLLSVVLSTCFYLLHTMQINTCHVMLLLLIVANCILFKSVHGANVDSTHTTSMNKQIGKLLNYSMVFFTYLFFSSLNSF